MNLNIPELAIIARLRIEDNLLDAFNADLDEEIRILAAEVCLEPLWKGNISIEGCDSGGEGKLTPGVMANTVKPSDSNAMAHWAVSMFIAALVIL